MMNSIDPLVSDDITLIDYWRIVWKFRRMIVSLVMATSVFAVIISLLIPNTFQARALLIPISARGDGQLSSIASQLGSLSALSGISIQGGGVTEKLMAILNSRTISESMINRMNLMPILFAEQWDAERLQWKGDDPKEFPTMEDAVEELQARMEFTSDKADKTITLTGEFRDPQFAADVVNAHISELRLTINRSGFTTAKRNRIFIENQLAENKAELLEAGKEISRFYTQNRVSNVDAMLDVDVGVTSVESLLAKKEDIAKKINEAKSVKNVPQQVYLTFIMMHRGILEKVNALLVTQYEMAKIEEAKEDLAFEVVDYAAVPIKKYKPKRSTICILAFLSSLFAAVFLSFLREYICSILKSERKAFSLQGA